MANPKLRFPENEPGEFFVDSTCIDCDACRQLAAETFAEGDEYSYVYRQHRSDEKHRSALRALLACPTGSIGTVGSNGAKAAMNDFPLHLEDGIYYYGFNSPKSFADLGESTDIGPHHISEAIQYRSLDRNLWQA